MNKVKEEFVRLAVLEYGNRLRVNQDDFIIDGIRMYVRINERGKRTGLHVGGDWYWGDLLTMPYTEILERIRAELDLEKNARSVSESE